MWSDRINLQQQFQNSALLLLTENHRSFRENPPQSMPFQAWPLPVPELANRLPLTTPPPISPPPISTLLAALQAAWQVASGPKTTRLQGCLQCPRKPQISQQPFIHPAAFSSSSPDSHLLHSAPMAKAEAPPCLCGLLFESSFSCKHSPHLQQLAQQCQHTFIPSAILSPSSMPWPLTFCWLLFRHNFSSFCLQKSVVSRMTCSKDSTAFQKLWYL